MVRFVMALACALSLAACGGGGGGGASAPTDNSSVAPPTSTGATLRPTLFIEKDGDGIPYLRVQEQTFDAFAPGTPQRTLRNQGLGPSPGIDNIVTGEQTTFVTGLSVVRMKVALDLMSSGLVSAYNVFFDSVDGGGDIYGAAIKLGANERPTLGATYIQRVYADAHQAPDGSYTIANTDFIGIEHNNKPIYVRDVTGRNFSDGEIDSKSTGVYVMNATLEGGHRMVRAWSGVEIIIANSIVNVSPGNMQVWVEDASATVKYYNTLWCSGAANPSSSDPNCQTTPWLVEGDGMSGAQAAQRVVALSSNPLPGVSPFFKTQIDHIVIEYSSDAGDTWHAFAAANTGASGSAPVGDPHYRIPFNFASGDYRFRAHYERGGATVGQGSQVINEAGAIVS